MSGSYRVVVTHEAVLLVADLPEEDMSDVMPDRHARTSPPDGGTNLARAASIGLA